MAQHQQHQQQPPRPHQWSPALYQQYPPHTSPTATSPSQWSTASVTKQQQPLSPHPQSPHSQSPYGNMSPQIANGTLPTTAFTNIQAQGPPNGFHPPPPHMNAPPTPTGSIMGPPSRPAEEKPADLNDLSDVLHSAGIDLRNEENELVNTNYARQTNAQALAPVIGSFNSSHSQSRYPDSPYLSQNSPGPRESFYGAGSFNQFAITPDDAEEHAERQLKNAIRNKCMGMQYHLTDPFLHTIALYKKVARSVKATQVSFPPGKAVYVDRLNPQMHYQLQTTFIPDPNQDSDGHMNTLYRLQGKTSLPSGGALADMITLLSLAAKERIRSLVEDSAALARGRRITFNGIVPADIQDLAEGQGEPTEATSAVSPTAKSLKRSFSEVNSLPTPVSEKQKSPRKTIQYPNSLAAAVTRSIESENTLEEARAAKRSKRNVESIMSGEASRAASASGTPAPGTPGTQGERAPDAPKKGLSKKEQKRQADAKAIEAQQHAATTSALNMAIGGGNLFGGKKISWMSSRKTAVESGFGPSRIPPAAQKAAAAGANKVASIRKLGEFREDKEGGAGIQLRDIIATIEAEPKERKALCKAYNRLGPHKR